MPGQPAPGGGKGVAGRGEPGPRDSLGAGVLSWGPWPRARVAEGTDPLRTWLRISSGRSWPGVTRVAGPVPASSGWGTGCRT